MVVDLAFQLPMRRWQARLAHDLKIAGHDVRLAAGDRRASLRVGTATAIAIERRIFGPKVSLFDATSLPVGFSTSDDVAADLTVALDGAIAASDNVVAPLFDGGVGDRALIAMVTSGRPPNVLIRGSTATSASDLVRATLAIEDQYILSRALHQVLARLVTLIVQSVRRFEDAFSEPAIELRSTPSTLMGPRALTRTARVLSKKLADRLAGVRRGTRWRIAYRRGNGRPAGENGGWTKDAFALVADDGLRFYADPMPFEHEGRTFIFCEEYPYATKKGVISVCEIDASGGASRPRTVLECGFHLSYPCVLRHGGEIYMLPEMGGTSRLQLFRAAPFPLRWVADRILVENVVASDATPIFHQGRWWLFATVSSDGGSSWDQLCLFHAPDLLGPWEPHVGNPVLVDAGAARPAGAMWHDGETLMRVAQDCRRSYGEAVVVCRVDRLDPLGYAQVAVARLEAPIGHGADGIHTFNRLGDLEVIDLRS